MNGIQKNSIKTLLFVGGLIPNFLYGAMSQAVALMHPTTGKVRVVLCKNNNDFYDAQSAVQAACASSDFKEYCYIQQKAGNTFASLASTTAVLEDVDLHTVDNDFRYAVFRGGDVAREKISATINCTQLCESLRTMRGLVQDQLKVIADLRETVGRGEASLPHVTEQANQLCACIARIIKADGRDVISGFEDHLYEIIPQYQAFVASFLKTRAYFVLHAHKDRSLGVICASVAGYDQAVDILTAAGYTARHRVTAAAGGVNLPAFFAESQRLVVQAQPPLRPQPVAVLPVVLAPSTATITVQAVAAPAVAVAATATSSNAKSVPVVVRSAPAPVDLKSIATERRARSAAAQSAATVAAAPVVPVPIPAVVPVVQISIINRMRQQMINISAWIQRNPEATRCLVFSTLFLGCTWAMFREPTRPLALARA